MNTDIFLNSLNKLRENIRIEALPTMNNVDADTDGILTKSAQYVPPPLWLGGHKNSQYMGISVRFLFII